MRLAGRGHRKAEDRKGFAVRPMRREVGRTFAWLGHRRRPSKDYEQCPPLARHLLWAMVYPMPIGGFLHNLSKGSASVSLGKRRPRSA